MTLWSIRVNNFFLFVLLLIYGSAGSGVEPKSAEPLLRIIGLLFLFPASSDPLAKIPASRFSVWPLSTGQRFVLRLASFALNSPVLWITVALLARTGRISVALGFIVMALAAQLVITIAGQLTRTMPTTNPLRWIPQLPVPLGGLICNNIRQLLTRLDFHLALALSVGGICYRYLTPNSDPSAAPAISILIALAIEHLRAIALRT